MNKAVYINRIAAYLPGEPVDNDRMESVLGMIGGRPSRARAIVLRSNGIKTRHYAIDPATGEASMNNAQLTAAAIRRLEGAGFTPDRIRCLACGTSSPDQLLPGHAVMVHGELGNPTCEVASPSGICISGIIALKYGYMAVLAGLHHNAVVTGSETASSSMTAKNFSAENEARVEELESSPVIAFEKDFLRWMLSDGAGAMLLEPQPNTEGRSLRIEWIEQFSYAHELPVCMYAGGDKDSRGRFVGWHEYPGEEVMKESLFSLKQDVKLLNDKVVHMTVERGMSDTLARHPLRPEEIDWFLPHYSSGFFRDKVYEGLRKVGMEIPFERWFTNLPSVGNVGSASVYLMLEELFNGNRLRRGQKILCYVPESGRFSTAFMLLTVV
ncbi:MAG TPA: StlD/DarB family beta-ketosynthase [Desulfurivibrio alkaliphilus]|uniref:StlD/DarB family beta-ketosynthase n=1 Tax=Desulfurivibrio alkaliphilus TaxID=427923 RepID=A0A7C2XLV9_9BACT|nr:StlD/DarB family beta-ketosynthase [Desulfurivibrio alkaliphilus]